MKPVCMFAPTFDRACFDSTEDFTDTLPASYDGEGLPVGFHEAWDMLMMGVEMMKGQGD